VLVRLPRGHRRCHHCRCRRRCRCCCCCCCCCCCSCFAAVRSASS